MSELSVRIDEKRFDGEVILRDLRFKAHAGEFIALVGPSGAGKSTLLNMLGGLDTGFAGELLWDDGPLCPPGKSPERLGMMFQEPRLLPWLSTLDNVRLVQPDPVAGRQRAQQLLTEVGLGHALDAWPNQLSGGMQRRVALARAFVGSPRLLLMDEPFVSLDMPTATRLRDALLTFWRRERPLVVFVTHDLREALTLADRVLFLAARPARVLWDYPVTLRRPRQLEGIEIAGLQAELSTRHPDLLSGVLDVRVPGTRRENAIKHEAGGGYAQ